MELDYSRLSEVKKGIIRNVYANGYTTSSSYPLYKEWLVYHGWLQGNQRQFEDGIHIISNEWMLTEAGRKAYEASKIG